MRLYGRRAFGLSSQYTIPQETANYITTGGPEGEDILKKPTTPPEGTVSGGVPATPEPGSKEMGSTSGYRQVNPKGESVFASNKKLWNKWKDHRIMGKVKGREWKGSKLVDLLPKGAK